MLADSQELRSEVIIDFVKNAKPRIPRGLLDLVVWGWLMLVAVLAVYVLNQTVLTFSFAFLGVASRMGALLAVAHDAQHNAFLPNKKWNDFLGAWFCAYPVGSIYGSSRAVHMAHHKLLNTPFDPDRNFHSEDDKNTPALFVGHFLKMVFGGQVWTSLVVNGFLRPTTGKDGSAIVNESAVARPKRKHSEFLNVVAVQLAIFLTLWAVSHQWWLYMAIWLGPIFTIGTFLGFLRGFVDHARLKSDCPSHSAGRLITVTSTSLLERMFFASFDFKFHGEHHLFPSVPHYYLPALHKLLQDDPCYSSRYLLRRSYAEFLHQYWMQISENVMSKDVRIEKNVT